MKVLIVLLATCVGASAFAAPDAPSPAAPAPAPVAGNGAAELKWHHTMKEAYAAALKERKAVLLVAGADWCGPCRMLEKEMAKPAAAKAIGNVVLVHLDVDRSPEAQAFLHSGAIPLLRILSPAGQRIDMKEGFLTAEDLAKWIDQQQERALEVADELLALGEPDATSLPRLINRLSDADATLREAAIRRLLPFPTTAAPSVVDAFASGGLASRLSCLELLSQWQAPVVTLDPWKPQTITEDHIKALATWANSVKPAAPPPPVELEHAQLDEAKQAIDRMLAANDPQQVRAMRDRLARLGPALMPLVREQLKAAASDSARERLLALRYRLTASEGLMLAWPGGIERLAATEARTRHVAVEELVARAGPDDGELLLELFADPDPFVRELSLRGLNATGRGDAARAFIGLLDDPDPNVQAAVLKQLAEKPSAAMLGPVVAFIQKQTDADLIVHAVRVLRASKSASAVGGLRKLLDHPSWRVRAESAEALSELVGRYGDASAVTRADVYAAMIKLLDDPDNFVVSRAALALRTADSPQVIEPMAKAADKHPELAAELIAGMTYNSEGRAIAEKYIRQFCGHKDERLRAHAATAIVSITSDVEKEMAALLKDESLNVRAKAAMAIFALVNSARERAGDTHSADFFSDTPPPPKDMLKWIEDYRAGKDRAAWIADVIPPLRELTNQPDAATRLAGALPLLALGPTDDPYQVVKAAVAADTSLVADAAEALPWLTSPQRVELFNELLPAVIGGKSAWPVVKGMSAVRDPAAAAA
ncbi:MAG: HEAT repeat domain-containing protein, partial [Phycisphaeraceae bacterium]